MPPNIILLISRFIFRALADMLIEGDARGLLIASADRGGDFSAVIGGTYHCDIGAGVTADTRVPFYARLRLSIYHLARAMTRTASRRHV